MGSFVYKENRTREISFPLGGIGTGCIGLAGNGRLIDWEIFNRPNKGSLNGFSHFAIKAEVDDKVIDARVLNGDLHPPYSGDYNRPHFESFGFGPHRSTMAGLPHFKEVEFHGSYPFAELRFIDEKFPAAVKMTAFNPFIPLNDRDSGIPGAFFEIEVENTLNYYINYSLALSLSNPFPVGTTVNTYEKIDNVHMIKLISDKYRVDEPEYGDMSAATDSEDVSYQEYWYRGRWFDNLGIYWRDFTTPRKFKNRSYSRLDEAEKRVRGSSDVSTLATHVSLGPNEKKTVRFSITWNFPNCYNYWNPEKCDCRSRGCETNRMTWKNFYATVFRDSTDSGVYIFKNWTRLYNDTLTFKKALFSSTIPKEAIDAVSANISILKAPTCLRLEDGSFYGFEGCHCDEGCCEGSCTHVWNYVYALPFLFPKLERSMIDLDFKYNQRKDGGMAFRLQLPLGRERWPFRPCADGQFGGVIKAYRNWKISGDTKWLKSNWEVIKNSIEFAWADTNEDKWDANRDGVLEGRQHHTLDMEVFGPNSWLTGFYLAALKAGAEMAEYLGEKETSKEYMTLFKKGKKWVDENLFNGEYYHQIIDLKDKSVLERYNEGVSLHGEETDDAYWNEEAQEIKYQIGEGCIIDQVLAQWHANLCGLGEIFKQEQTKKALQSIYKYNFKQNMRQFFNPCRIFALNDEAATVICEWPEGKYKPVTPIPYSEEAMNGFEYQVGIHMIQEGLLKEGMTVVKAVRDRYNGEKRNPWNEFECGSNYARSMASYALLLAFSGFEYDMVKGMIGFNPIINQDNFRCFWSLDSGWGTFEVCKDVVKLNILNGYLKIKTFKLTAIDTKKVVSVVIGNENIRFKVTNVSILFDTAVELSEGCSLVITLCCKNFPI